MTSLMVACNAITKLSRDYLIYHGRALPIEGKIDRKFKFLLHVLFFKFVLPTVVAIYFRELPKAITFLT